MGKAAPTKPKKTTKSLPCETILKELNAAKQDIKALKGQNEELNNMMRRKEYLNQKLRDELGAEKSKIINLEREVDRLSNSSFTGLLSKFVKRD